MPYKLTKTKEVCLLLDNIRSVHNVGSIFRTAETAGVAKIYCLGTTPLPVDRFGRKRKDLAKVALGAEDLVKWEHVEDEAMLIKQLKKQGFRIIAIEQAPNSVDYREVKPHEKSLFILGNEVGGVSQEILKLVDVIAEIPLKGKKESLNVSVAAGIALYSIIV
jgi:23S rRNA (guanosine2251-2'-O)-methyltransferase